MFIVTRKPILVATDLAINGAAPAFSGPVHVGRPSLLSRDRFLELASGIFDRGWVTNNGPLVQELESKLCAELGVAHCVAMCNGTIAMEIATRALGLHDEVIVPSWTFIATAHSLFWQGITPVFADVDRNTHNLDPSAVKRMITPRTTGIIGVHLWGRPSQIEILQEIADEFKLSLLFDAAHAFGCTHRGRTVGAFGRAEVFSFHATKSFSSFEGGAVTTNDEQLAEKMRLMRNFGFHGFDNVIHPGTNGKMTEICAAMGIANLESFREVLAINRRNYEAYRAELSDIEGVSLLAYDTGERGNFHYIVVELHDSFPAARDEVISALHAENILARRYFWPGCHRMKPYRDLFPNAGLLLRNTEDIAARVIVLPSGTSLPDGTIETVGDVFRVLSKGA